MNDENRLLRYRGWLLVIGAALAGCAQPEAPATTRDLGLRDLARPADLTGRDLAGADLTTPAADAGADLTAVVDLAGNTQDLTTLPDLAVPPDLGVPADLTTLPDLTKLPDLTTLPDLVVACTPQMSPCDTVCQNCPSGQKCDLTGTNKYGCVANGTVPTGGVCGNGGGSCVAGNVCTTESTAIPLALCRLYCRTDADCKNGGRCVFTLSGSTAKVCSDPITACDTVAQTGCMSGSCYVVTPTGMTGCHTVYANGGQYASCTTSYDCKAGFACFSNGCLRTCHSTNDCPFPYTCYQVTNWTNNTNTGVCDF